MSLESKKYNFFVATLLPREYQILCCTYIGQGASICVKKEYKNIHHGSGKGGKVPITSEQMFFQKSKYVVLMEPTQTSLIDKSLLNDWLRDSKTLNEWLDIFPAAEKATFMEK